MPVTLNDVALRAGVSIKTVSNVVTGYPHISPATRQRVEEAIAELNYRPNLSARSLRRGRSGVIALAVPELSSPYFAELAESVVQVADREGFMVFMEQTEGKAARERLVLEGIRAHLIDGLIFSPLALEADELAGRTDTTPLVLLGERVSGASMDHVVIDNVAAARSAVVHLAELGRSRIAAIGVLRSKIGETARLRLAGYRAGLSAAGLPYRPELVAETRAFRREDGATAMAKLLEGPSRPDAVFAFNDLIALGALRNCYERGLRVPEDIAIIGIDDVEDGRYSVPSLSTISPDRDFIAQTAVDLLVARLSSPIPASDGGPAPTNGSVFQPRHVVAPHRLLVRESTAGRGAR
jgi:DNA-binding LacI/PurR family transcriptional regulator